MLYTILLAALLVFAIYSALNRGPTASAVRSDLKFLEFGLKN